MKINEGRKRGWFWVENEIFDYGIANHIGNSALTIHFALCRHADEQGKSFPTVQTLQFETGLSNRVIAKSTRILEQYYLLEIQREKHQHNVYIVKSVRDAIRLNNWNIPASDEKSPVKEHVTKGHEARDESSLGHPSLFTLIPVTIYCISAPKVAIATR